jgi:hypothetical protein
LSGFVNNCTTNAATYTCCMVPVEARNAWLTASDAELLAQCREEHHRASGPGGQRRNKVQTAIRLHHLPSAVTARASESRSLAENRRHALRRLRERIAFEVRCPLGPPPPAFSGQRSKDGKLSVSRRNPLFPLIAATALDALAGAGGRYAEAASALGVTTSQLLRLLKSEDELWRATSAALSSAKKSPGRPGSPAPSGG